ncbi:uroporphyrin-III C-methyltransferase/precorrin-2 dehydrogenase/sirohydrochlorin ferrochelatase [Rubricella aquisinus]|uniref:Uroporphyrin-III C-methyltransferase/precorrin-2 dehydrogenase/sirohydrochlorin ferrochelatase n=1 Tax=Rubricella aquisinus TaxID=2028108 RepID=A0A840WXF9_9RHOB|nr:siroheme synthase CysG [Rubricella aquisinus]MBB5515860.1 uroporphyrin-III C-methyltransferase/precorrin-2 dehydrogenase/sirohydrochlorin ferrochelatase [Rubricella aquisinus]
MRHFPIFVALEGRRVVVSGAGECAVAKLRLILKTDATVAVYGSDPDPQVIAWAAEGKLRLTPRPIAEGDATCAVLVYGANEDAAEDARAVAIGRRAGALTNIVDNLADSQFITPAIVDRDPVTVAIGTEGAAPVVARDIKRRVEEMLPTSLGLLARIGQAFRPLADALPKGRVRRDFWSKFYFERGPRALEAGGEDAAREALDALLADTLSHDATPGHVSLIGAGPGDPELLTLKARRLVHEADVVIHDRLVGPGVLELARREAEVICVGKTGFGPSWKQADIDALIVEKALAGAKVARLKGGDPAVFGRLDEEIDALDAAGVTWDIVPGITTASAAAAAMGQSLTKRGRNASFRLLTGHDVKGFAEQDWRALAKPGAVAAIYMGRKAATFIRGRLMIHGGADTTPVTVIENATRADQRIVETTLLDLPETLDTQGLTGPVLMMLGLAPRSAAQAVHSLSPQLAEAL